MDATVLLGGELSVGRIGLGTNRIDDDAESRAILRAALERGVNFIDTADIYSGGISESVIGTSIGDESGVVIATKGGYHGASPQRMAESIDASLRRLGAGSIDLYYLHRPDPQYAIEQSVEAILEARRAGKIRHVGLSSVSVEQIQTIEQLTPIAAVQNEYNLNNTKHNDVIDYCTQRGIAFVPFFPLRGASGATVVAQRLGATPHQVVLAAMLKRSPILVPIPGTRSVDHLMQNLAAMQLELTDAEVAELLG
ncbi:MAG: aldo/keto reductase [Solirubrobacterales bacterium]